MLKERLVKLAGDLQPNEFALLYPHGITITRIIGDKEIAAGEYALKNMQTGEQKNVSAAKIAEAVGQVPDLPSEN